MLTWKQRRRLEQTEIARHLIRESRCGCYRVVEWLPLLNAGTSTFRRFVAMYLAGRVWRLISDHHLEQRAIAACEQHERG